LSEYSPFVGPILKRSFKALQLSKH
jgi:hypothetical protein